MFIYSGYMVVCTYYISIMQSGHILSWARRFCSKPNELTPRQCDIRVSAPLSSPPCMLLRHKTIEIRMRTMLCCGKSTTGKCCSPVLDVAATVSQNSSWRSVFWIASVFRTVGRRAGWAPSTPFTYIRIFEIHSHSFPPGGEREGDIMEIFI